MDWLTGTFAKKMLGTPWYVWMIVALLIALFFALTRLGKREQWNSKRIAYAAMCIAVAFVLSCLRLYKMPSGGSITPLSMLPIILFSLAFGPSQGALVGCAYGLLQLLQDPTGAIHPIQILIDFPLAFAALALAGFAAKLPLEKFWKLPLAVVFAALGRYALAVLSGVVFFGANAPAGQPVLLYSLLYNLTYLGPDALLCLGCALFIPAIARLVKLLNPQAE